MQLAEEKIDENDLPSFTNTQSYPSENVSKSEAIALTSRTQPSSMPPEIWEDEFNSSFLFGSSLQYNPWETQPSPLNTSLSSTKPSQGFTNLPSIGLQDDTKQFSTSDDITNAGNKENLYRDFLRGQGISSINNGLELDNQLFPTKQSFQSYSDLLNTSSDIDTSTLPAYNQISSADGGSIIGKNISSLELLSQLRQRQAMRDIGNTCYPASSQKMNSSSSFQLPLRSNIAAPLNSSLHNSEAQFDPYKSSITTAAPAQKEQTGMDSINTTSFEPFMCLLLLCYIT